MASSSSSLNWLYDVFLSFRGEDIRKTFLSHVFKEFDRKLINTFKDYEIEKSHSLWPVLEKAIWSSRIAVVVFSTNYASSRWCLNELLEIVNCNIKIIIPLFYGVDPSDVRNQTGDFGRIFEETCKKNNTEEVKDLWKKALTDVANMVGYDFANCDKNEAKMIEEIANDVLRKLLSTSSFNDFENFVGIEDHMAKMSELLQLESEEVRMVSIWGSSGIGKTIIARALYNQLPQRFQGSIFIDRAFVSKSKEAYTGANLDDYNMKLYLQEQFLSKILGRKDIEIGHLGALRERLQHLKVLIIIDDLDDLMVLEVLANKTQWFGSGSRIIVVTNDKHLLEAHEIVHIYEVSLPTKVKACQMLCQSAFGKNYAPEGFEKLVVEVARHAGNLPLGLNVLGKYLKGHDKEYWIDTLPRLQNSLEYGIEKTLRISYDGLRSEKDQAVFRHIACLFNHMGITYIKSLLADSELDVNTALRNLADKSLIHVREGYVVMHSLLEKMGRKIVCIDEPEKREFLVDPKDICFVLREGIGTSKVLGISLDTSEIDDFHVHENTFKKMCNLSFLQIYSREKEVRVHLPESFDCLPPKLKLLWWLKYPMRFMPSKFSPERLVKLSMQGSKLEKLWEGVASLTCLKEIDLRGSCNLKEIPDLSTATNLEILILIYCSSLVELPSSIRNLNKLTKLDMGYCHSLETLPTGFNLKSLEYLIFEGCKELRTFPKFSTNISYLNLRGTNIKEFPCNLLLGNLVRLYISKEESAEREWEGVKPLTPFLAMLSPTLTTLHLMNIPNLVELPSSFQHLNQLKVVLIKNCRNLETLPTGINLKSLDSLILSGCSRLRSFPEISTNISILYLDETGIEEVPSRIENFYKLNCLIMKNCRRLKCVSLHISKLKHLKKVYFPNCWALTRVDLSGNSSEVDTEKDNIDTVPEKASSSLSNGYLTIPKFDFSDCFKLDKEALLQPQSISFDYMILAGEEVPSYFTHRTTGMSSLTNIPLLDSSPSQPFFRFRVCAVVNAPDGVEIDVNCQFKGKNGNSFDSIVKLPNSMVTRKGSHQLLIFDCCISLNKDNAHLPQLNYDHVDIKIHLSAGPPSCKLMFSIRGWGIRLLEDFSSPENHRPNTCPPRGDLLLLRQSIDSMFRTMSRRELVSYFTYSTTGTSLTNIPLPHTSLSQPVFRFKALVQFDCKSSGQFSYFYIHVSCRFRGGFGNHFDSPYRPYRYYKSMIGLGCDVLECLFPLNEGDASLAQLNYDHVDIHFQVTNIRDSTARLTGCGIHFLEDCSSPENRIGNRNTLQHVCESDADNTVSDGCHETKYSEECEDSGDGDKGSESDQFEECRDSHIDSKTDQLEECGDSENDQFEECGDSEIDQFEECGDSDIGSENDQFEECETVIWQ